MPLHLIVAYIIGGSIGVVGLVLLWVWVMFAMDGWKARRGASWYKWAKPVDKPKK